MIRKIFLYLALFFCAGMFSCERNNDPLQTADIFWELPDLHVRGAVEYPHSPYQSQVAATYRKLEAPEYYLDDTDHYVKILDIGEDALLARVHLIRNAQKSILIQTYIWREDESGKYVLSELIKAAQRGVKVKILTDYFATTLSSEMVAYLLDDHPNIEFKYFNPTADRVDPSVLEVVHGFLFEFKEFNQRLHNKIFVVDDRIAITGGRNYENNYFDMSRTLNFKDRDVVVVGPVVQAFTETFSRYWAYKACISARDFTDIKRLMADGAYKKSINAEDFDFGELFGAMDHQASDQAYVKKRLIDNAVKVRKLMFVADDPWKNRSDHLGGGGKAARQLSVILSLAKDTIMIQSPYFILDKRGERAVRLLRKKNPDLDIILSTNSLAATDSIYAYAAAFRQKKMFVRDLRFRIFEMRPIPADIGIMMPNYLTHEPEFYAPENRSVVNELMVGLSLAEKRRRLCIHAKSFTVDDEIGWIGSFNLDPRSVNLNTEVGLVVWDKVFTNQLKESIALDILPGNSWTVGKKKRIPIVSGIMNILSVVTEYTPIVEIWPLQYSSVFRLKEGKEVVPFYHKDFYENYEDVGPYPEVEMSLRKAHLRVLRAFIGLAKSII